MPNIFTSLMTRLSMLKPIELLPQIPKQTRFQRFYSYAIVRIILAALFIAPVIAIGNVLSIFVLDRVPGIANLCLESLRAILTIIFMLLAYRLYCRKIEHREAKEISLKYSVQEWAWGFKISLLLMLIMVGILAVGGLYQIGSISSYNVLIKACYIFITGAFIQEFIFRVLLYKVVEEYIGSWRAIVAIAAFFALVHMGNEHSNFVSSGSLFLSDFVLTAVFILTRRIWMVWGMHAGWNFFQDGILGMPNSGIDSFPSMIKPIISGPAWLTGGNFGVESSLPSVVLSVILAIVILWVASKHQQILPPKWKRSIY